MEDKEFFKYLSIESVVCDENAVGIVKNMLDKLEHEYKETSCETSIRDGFSYALEIVYDTFKIPKDIRCKEFDSNYN